MADPWFEALFRAKLLSCIVCLMWSFEKGDCPIPLLLYPDERFEFTEEFLKEFVLKLEESLDGSTMLL